MSRRVWLPSVAYLLGVTLFFLTSAWDRSDLALDDHLAAFFWIGFWLAVLNALGFVMLIRAWEKRQPVFAWAGAVWFLAIALFGALVYGPYVWDRFDVVALVHTSWLWLTIGACLAVVAWVVPRPGAIPKTRP